MSVYRRGQSWWYNFFFRGVRYQEKANVGTRDEALHAEATRKAEIAASLRSDSNARRALRFLDFAKREFEPWCAVEHKDRPSTHARYMRSIKALSEFLGERTLASIDAGLVEKYKMHRCQQPRKHARDGRLVSTAAVNRDLAVLRILFNYAVRVGQAKSNPVTEVKFFRERQMHVRALSVAEEESYLASAAPLLRCVAIVMLDTGMRPCEVYSLQREDFDLELRSVHVRSGKTDNAKRYIPLTRRAADVLADRLSTSQCKWLFPCPFDPTKAVQSVRKAHDAAVIRSGITPRFRLYDLRHTALSRMAMAGVDLPTLKELAGHSQIQMTMRYVHPSPEHKRRALQKFEEYVVGQTTAR